MAVTIVRVLYNIAFYLAIPFITLRLLKKARRLPAYRKRWSERFACFKNAALAHNSIWIHAASVGETNAAVPLVKALRKACPETPIVFTTMTPTGLERVQKNFGNEVIPSHVPYDYSGAVKRFLAHFKPKLLIIMETELWPNILHYCGKQNIPVVLASARLSAGSFTGYRRIKKFTQNMLANIKIIAAQTSKDQERFLALGAMAKQVKLIGNLKFDISLPVTAIDKGKALRSKWGQERAIFLAASTHQGEEEQLLAAFKQIKQNVPEALLVLVPRHPERFAEVAALCQQQGFKTISHKNQDICIKATDIVIGDTMGELLFMFGAADVAFVGGSLIKTVGGHNLLEPAAMGVATITGNCLFNFTEISELLNDAGALTIVNNVAELQGAVTQLLQNLALRAKQTTAGQKVLEQNRGALDRLMRVIFDVFAI
ncbi:MAG: lipid IV(A) 3-deoxy-D-manno-octulosonic acid transferase [Gammaproteobacteria bacterium]|nr:lipid IV(A) 3-deoxy-D-manno-octulosonic acid transferase [Gammaproteobacteria bacterium]